MTHITINMCVIVCVCVSLIGAYCLFQLFSSYIVTAKLWEL